MHATKIAVKMIETAEAQPEEPEHFIAASTADLSSHRDSTASMVTVKNVTIAPHVEEQTVVPAEPIKQDKPVVVQ